MPINDPDDAGLSRCPNEHLEVERKSIIMPPLIETDRLILRLLEPADATFILRLLNEPSFLRFIGDRGVHDLASAAAYITNGPQESYRLNGLGMLLVGLKATPFVPIGICGVMKKPWLADPDLAYAFVPEATSKGYASEAAAAVLADVRSRLTVPRIVAVVAPDNPASIRVLEKLGFSFECMIMDPAAVELKLFHS